MIPCARSLLRLLRRPPRIPLFLGLSEPSFLAADLSCLAGDGLSVATALLRVAFEGLPPMVGLSCADVPFRLRLGGLSFSLEGDLLCFLPVAVGPLRPQL